MIVAVMQSEFNTKHGRFFCITYLQIIIPGKENTTATFWSMEHIQKNSLRYKNVIGDFSLDQYSQ